MALVLKDFWLNAWGQITPPPPPPPPPVSIELRFYPLHLDIPMLTNTLVVDVADAVPIALNRNTSDIHLEAGDAIGLRIIAGSRLGEQRI